MNMMILCFRSTPAPLCRKAAECLLSARFEAACRLEEAKTTWRLRRGALVIPAAGGSWSLGFRWAGRRAPLRHGPLLSTRWRPCRTQLVLRGGHGSLAVNSRALLSTGGRELSGKNDQKADTPQGDAFPVPGQGLFKFKELVSTSWL